MVLQGAENGQRWWFIRDLAEEGCYWGLQPEGGDVQISCLQSWACCSPPLHHLPRGEDVDKERQQPSLSSYSGAYCTTVPEHWCCRTLPLFYCCSRVSPNNTSFGEKTLKHAISNKRLQFSQTPPTGGQCWASSARTAECLFLVAYSFSVSEWSVTLDLTRSRKNYPRIKRIFLTTSNISCVYQKKKINMK